MKSKTLITILLLINFFTINGQEMLPAISVENINGVSTNLRYIATGEKNIVCIVFGQWCEPCVKALDYLNNYNSEYDVKIIPIIIPVRNTLQSVKDFYKNRNYKFELYFAKRDDLISFKVESAPFYFLSDNSDVINSKLKGLLLGDEGINKLYSKDPKVKSIHYLDSPLKESIGLISKTKLTEILGKIPIKDEYEKQETYNKRYNDLKKGIERKFTSLYYERLYFYNKFMPLLQNIQYNYDAENKTLKIFSKKVKPFFIKIQRNKADRIISEKAKIFITNGDFVVINENLFEIKSGSITIFNDSYSINNSLPFNKNKIIETANNILLAERSKIIIPEILFYNEGNLTLDDVDAIHIKFNGSPFLSDYRIEMNNKITAQKNKILRTITETETIKQYKKNISLDNIDVSFDWLVLYNIFRKYNPEFNFKKWDNIKYDSENEIFKISYNLFGYIYIPVPIDKAREVGEKLKSKDFKIGETPKFVFIDKTSIALKQIVFIIGGKYYYYDIKDYK